MGAGDRKFLTWLGIGALAGLLLGLAIGWWWWPVQWTNAQPTDLAAGYQEDYLAMVADSYALTSDLAAARARIEGWPTEELGSTTGQLFNHYQAQGRSLDARRVQELSTALGTALVSASPTPAAAGSGEPIWLRVLKICGILLAGLLIVAGIALGVSTWQRKGLLKGLRLPKGGRPRPQTEEASAEAPSPGAAPGESRRDFFTTYHLGDDAYDESFSIESAGGEFLGECGVSIAETLGSGDPDKVCAFEVWLFDRNDIRTVTKVLASDYAFHDPDIRARQDTKGEVVLATPGKTIILETASLQVTAEVLEMEYGADEAPADSFFSKLVLQLHASVQNENGSAAL
ncbi:MAG: hypothetical protein GX605_09880 [Chloroflexi bacterium]|nr:hypothetical protein [Chloroflexota bacterium]